MSRTSLGVRRSSKFSLCAKRSFTCLQEEHFQPELRRLLGIITLLWFTRSQCSSSGVTLATFSRIPTWCVQSTLHFALIANLSSFFRQTRTISSNTNSKTANGLNGSSLGQSSPFLDLLTALRSTILIYGFMLDMTEMFVWMTCGEFRWMELLKNGKKSNKVEKFHLRAAIFQVC